MILGGKQDRAISTSFQKVAVNIGQLIRFNSVKQIRRQGIKNFRHSTKNEPPLPVLVGLMVHAKTGKRKLVDPLSIEGTCVNYERVLDIRRAISTQVCMEYQTAGFVCPSQLHDHGRNR